MESKKDYEKLYRRILSQANRDDIPQVQKERYLYMLQKIDDLQKKGNSFESAVKNAWHMGNLDYSRKRQKEAEEVRDAEKTKFFKKMRGHSLGGLWYKGQDVKVVERGKEAGGGKEFNCMNCNALITDYPCPMCGHDPRKKQEKPKSYRETAGKRIMSRIYEALIFIFIGIFCWVGLPFFGLPSFTLMAVAFIVFIPAYIFLQSEHEVMDLIEGGDVDKKGWLLLPKSLMKLIAYILIIAQFFMYNRLIALGISFFFYFTLPTRYKTSQPYKAMEAWARMGFGAFLAIMFFITFGGGFSVSSSLVTPVFILPIGVNPVAAALGLLGAAFFITFPMQIEADADDKKINISFTQSYGSFSKGNKFSYIDKTIFTILMLAGLAAFGFSTDALYLIFYCMWALSLFVGLSAGPEGRPAMGIITILIALFIFSSTYTSTVGQAIFGYWWPQVQSFTETLITPLSDMWYQAQTGMSDAWLMMTNPQAYYLQQQQKQQATKSAVKSGGTVKSIELSKFDLFPSLTGILDPKYDKLVGSIELQNQGEFDANKIILDIWSTYTDPETSEVITVGTFDDITCSKPFDSISGESGNTATCDWSAEDLIIYPSEMKLSNIVYKIPWTSGKDLTLCENATGSEALDDPIPCPNCQITSECSMPVYTYSGHTVKVNVNYTYDYNVNVSMPVDVINKDKYQNLLEAREITLQDVTSQYTGGPVKATIWSQRQPIRDGEQSLFVASIVNEGRGLLSKVNKFEVKIPQELNRPVIVSQTFRTSSPQTQPEANGCSLDGPTDGYWVITCSNTYGDIERDDFKRVSFFVTPNYGSSLIDKRTTIIIGLANYEYIKTDSETLTIANAPPQ